MFKQSLEAVALYGGSFDPPHLGHKSVIEEALKSLEIDKLIVVPTYLNPFKTSSYATAEQRFLLSKNMFESFTRVLVSNYEIEEGKATPTVQTLIHFQKSYDVQYIIIGADNLASIEKWNRFEYLNSEITWIVATRKGYKLDTKSLRSFQLLEVNVDISSTQIRNKNTKVQTI